MTYRQDYETLFYVVILSDHHHHHRPILKTVSTDSDTSLYNTYDSMDSEKSHSKFSSNLKDHLISPMNSRSR
jgi:hypothetical protein